MFDKEDSRFHDLLNTVDSVSSELHRKGVGSQQKQSSVITREDENLWDKVILGSLTPVSAAHNFYLCRAAVLSKRSPRTIRSYYSIVCSKST